MSFKKMILILSVTMVAILLCLFGASFAYYSLNNASTEFETSTSNDDISVIYEQSQFISVNTGIPITSEQVNEKAASSKFSVLAGNNLTGYDVAIQINLTDVVIDEALKVSDFKLQFLENNVVIANLTGEDITSNSITLKSLSKVTVGTTYNYELKIWLNDTGVSQNDLMNKAFSGRFEVTSSMRK